jgi:DNA-binding PucR family transcriptional regulator
MDSSYIRTAEVLAIHVNSVRYRLGRIEALTGLRATETRSVMHASLALELLGLFEAEPAPAHL